MFKIINYLLLVYTCISIPHINYTNTQLIKIMKNVYNVGIPYTELNCNCNYAININDDGFLLCNNSNNYLLAFSGSQNIIDWIDDLDITSTINNEIGINMQTHNGFNKKFYQWKSTIDLFFPIYNKSIGTIILIGHSLGGAIAHISSLYLAGQGYSIILITAGEPATFKQPFSLLEIELIHIRFITYFNQINCYLTEYSKDMIPFITNIIGYEHATTNTIIQLHHQYNCINQINLYYINNTLNDTSDLIIHKINYYEEYIDNIY